MEFLQDYDFTVNYHPRKVNMVADALSMKVNLAHMMVREMSMLSIASECKPRIVGEKVFFGNVSVYPVMMLKIKEAQENDEIVQKCKDKVLRGELSGYSVNSEGILRYQERLFLPNNEDIKQEVLREAHCSRYTLHPRNNKMYQDLKQKFCWDNMKREIVIYNSKCLTC